MQALKGTHDILPDEVYKWDYMEGVIRDVCARYGYKEIRTPIIEATELFQRGIGDTTDVVTKEMYTFKDRGNRSVTLRPENTASAVRAYLEHKMYGDQQVHKMFYIGSMFRYDRPQPAVTVNSTSSVWKSSVRPLRLRMRKSSRWRVRFSISSD